MKPEVGDEDCLETKHKLETTKALRPGLVPARFWMTLGN